MTIANRVFNPDTEHNFVDWIESILSDIEFPGYIFQIYPDRDGAKIQAHYFELDIATGAMGPQFTRKWLVSPHACESEVVRTVFKCVATSMEHRTREGFKWKGQRIFGPHIDIYALHDASRKVDVRAPEHEQ